MTLAPPTPEVRKFLTSLEAFLQNPPRDLPDGVVDNLTELRGTLKGYGSEEQSPGEREAVKAAGKEAEGSDLGESFRTATRGPDQPTPGQREVLKAQEAMNEAAAAIGATSD